MLDVLARKRIQWKKYEKGIYKGVMLCLKNFGVSRVWEGYVVGDGQCALSIYIRCQQLVIHVPLVVNLQLELVEQTHHGYHCFELHCGFIP